MNWLKVITKSGRQELVREVVKEYVTPQMLSKLAADGVAKAIESGTLIAGEERVAKIACGCEYGGKFCAELGKAVNPEGDGGMTITENEKVNIALYLNAAIVNLVPTAACDKLVDLVVSKVP